MTPAVTPDGRLPERAVSRRRVGVWGAGAVALSAAGCDPGSSRSGQGRTAGDASVRRWRATRGTRYLIAHRGSGDVLPEHSLPAYRAALGWGAACMELSVGMTSDGQLICLHDLTYDRTTTGHGLVSAQPASVLDHIGIRAPQLGAGWLRTPLPRVPTLEQALALLGGRTVLALEAKNDAAYEPMLALATKAGLRDSIIVKAYVTSRRIEQAHDAGYGVFAYLGPGEVTPGPISALAARLDGSRDYLGIPSLSPVALWPDELIRGAVARGVPIWVYPVHRRSEARHYFDLGVQGAVASSYGYLAGRVPVATSDDWSTRKVASGQICRDQSTTATAPAWTGSGELTLAAHGIPQMITMGQLGPIASPDSYRIDLSARWAVLPTDRTAGLCLTVAHVDDRYYQVGSPADGYNAVLAPDGTVRLLRHDRAAASSTLLAHARLPAIAAGQHVQLSLEVNPGGLRWQVASGGRAASVETSDSAHRGGYLHVGRLSTDGALVLRSLGVWGTGS